MKSAAPPSVKTATGKAPASAKALAKAAAAAKPPATLPPKSARSNRYLPAPEPPRPSRLGRTARAVAHFAKLGTGVALVLGTAGATAFGGYRLALSSPQFALEHVELKSGSH